MLIRTCLQCVLALSFVAVGQVHALQDPTRPPKASVPDAQDAPARKLELGSILLGSARRVAVIEGVALREGESHNGIQVQRIYRHKVEILDQGRFRVLYPETLPQVRRGE